MKNIICIILLTLLFTGCEKVVNLKYKDNQSRIIIEGNVSNIPGPYLVKITRSVSLTTSDANPAIDNATVTLSDDAGNSETLTSQGGGAYSSATTKGVPGRTYTLTVQAESKTYTAQSTMPQQVALDAVKVEEITVTGEKQYNLIPVYKDPIEKGNYYRFVLTVNNKLINQHFVQNDEIRNGEVNTVRLETNDDDLKLKRGDEISITMYCIDPRVYLYYKTLALMGDSGPGGGTTPNNPPNNLSGDVLGLFSAHTVETKRVTIP